MRSRRVRKLFCLTAGLVVLAASAADTAAQDWRTITQMRQTTGDRNLLQVAVQYGAGTLDLSAGDPGLLYRATMRYDAEAFQPDFDYQPGRLRVGLEDVRVRGRNVRAGELDIRLGPDVPVDLQLEFGAARANLDLTGIPLRAVRLATGASETVVRVSSPNPIVCESIDFDVGAARFQAFGLANLNAQNLRFSGGVGEVTLDFTGDWTSNMSARLRMGLGSLTLRVPRGLGLQVRKGGLLVGFDSQGLIKRGDVYETPDWAQAEHRLTIDIEAAFGSIRVVWVDPDAN
jgi:hypothetical protein